MKLDAHQHFWRYNNTEYCWIGEPMKILQKDFLPSDLYAELQTISFDGSIVVQARQNLAETKWLLELASQNSFIKGVVGWVDLCSREIENQLGEFSSYPKLVGVRHVVHDEPNDKFMARKDFQNGISLLAKHNLTYDLLLFPGHLPLAVELVNMFPRQKFVLDHISKPSIKNQIYEPWNKDIRLLAQNSNVYCKLSGMVTEAHWQKWKPADFNYYLNTLIDCFGENRLMIGSDWPVCLVAGSYYKVMSLIINYARQFNEEIRSKILGRNGEEFYLT